MRLCNGSQLQNAWFVQFFQALFDFSLRIVYIILSKLGLKMQEDLFVGTCNSLLRDFLLRSVTYHSHLIFDCPIPPRNVSDLERTSIHAFPLDGKYCRRGLLLNSRGEVPTDRHVLHFADLFLLDLFLNLVEEFPASLDDDPEELASFDLVLPDLNSVVPNADDQHNVFNLHLLQQVQQFLSGSILAVIIKSLSHYLSLRQLIHLRHSVS